MARKQRRYVLSRNTRNTQLVKTKTYRKLKIKKNTAFLSRFLPFSPSLSFVTLANVTKNSGIITSGVSKGRVPAAQTHSEFKAAQIGDTSTSRCRRE